MSDELDADRLAEYLRAGLPDRPDLRVTRLRRTPGGMSRETWFADTEWTGPAGPQQQRLTVRRDPAEGAVVDASLRFEHDVMAGLWGSAVPVAETLLFENDPSWFGRPFYVRDCVAGEASPKAMFAPGAEELRHRLGLRLVELLADLHTLDWERRGFGEFMEAPQDARDAALLELRKWKRYFERTAAEPQPAATELFAWLERNAPTEVARISLIWGDVGVGNFIYRGDEIVALTDWEQAHLGDPMKDVAAALWRGIESIVSKDEFYSIYQERTGIEIDERSVEYYKLFIDAQYTTMSGSVLQRFAPEGVPDITFARLGLGISYRCMEHGLAVIAGSS